MGETIKVGIADLKFVSPPDKITTIGLGSCVGVVLYDKQTKQAGLIHVMLPDSTKIRNNENKYKFADTGMDCLVAEMKKKGSLISNLRAKMAGGAMIFNFSTKNDLGSIGDQNAEAVRKKLAYYGIKLVAEDCGKNCGRTVIFDPQTFDYEIVTAGRQRHII